jgi:hypothetical protein
MTNAGTISQAAPAAARDARWRPVTVRATLRSRLRWLTGQGVVLVCCRESLAWSTGSGLARAAGLAR